MVLKAAVLSILASVMVSTSAFANEFTCAMGELVKDNFELIKEMKVDTSNADSSDFVWLQEGELLGLCQSSENEKGKAENSLLCAFLVKTDDATAIDPENPNTDNFDWFALGVTAGDSSDLLVAATYGKRKFVVSCN